MSSRTYRVVYRLKSDSKGVQRVIRVVAPGPNSAATHVRLTKDEPIQIIRVEPPVRWRVDS